MGKNAIQARIWRRGRILIGGDWGKELLLAKKKNKKALRHARAGLIWGQIGICFEYIGKDMWREVVEPRPNYLERLGPDCERKSAAGRVGTGEKGWNERWLRWVSDEFRKIILPKAAEMNRYGKD